MHNLFLGTAKRMFQLWIERDLLTKEKLKLIEERINKLDVGTGFGKLPHKIASNHGRYKASQWKNWTIIYSTYALHGVLSQEHLNCWHTFVMACCLPTVPVLSHKDLKKADMLLLKFCRQFEELYGKSEVRINMHLHCHLKECIEDYGPIYSFWCFAFERYNGNLGSTATNNGQLKSSLWENLCQNNLCPILSCLRTSVKPLLPSSTSIKHHKCLKVYQLVYLHCSRCLLILNWQLLTGLTFLSFPYQMDISLCIWIQMIANCLHRLTKPCTPRNTLMLVWLVRYVESAVRCV